MSERNQSAPAFEARRLSSAIGWYVRVVWPHGKREHIPGFMTQREALKWIDEKAQSWLSEQPLFPTGFSRETARDIFGGRHIAVRAKSS